MYSKSESTLLPVMSLLLAAALWGLLWYPLRLLEDQGMSSVWTTLVAYCAALLAGLLVTWRRRREWFTRPWVLVGLGLASGWCNVSFVVALVEGNVVRVILLFYLSPLWTVLLGRVLLGERLTRDAILVFGIAVAGALIMLWDPRIGWPWPQAGADWLAISSGFAFALANVSIRYLQDVSIPVKTTATWVGCVLIAVLWIAFTVQPVPVVSQSVWLWCVVLGLLGFTTMTLSVQYGVTHMPVHRSAVLLLFEIVVAAVSAQLLSAERMQAWEWAGGILVVCAALIAAHAQRRESAG